MEEIEGFGVALASGCRSTVTGTPDDAPPIAVAIAEVRTADMPATFEAGGIVRARATALVASRILAPVAAVHVRAGDRVRRGARLVTLDGREIAANHARAAATVVSATEGVGAAEGTVRSAEAALVLARATDDRLQALYEKRSATTEERDQAAAALGAADGQLQSARANLAAAVAARDAALAGSDAASVVASYTTLTAPFDGIVTDRRVDPGDMATPGAPLVTIEDPSAFRLEVTLDETRAAAVRVGQAAEVSIDTSAIEPTRVKASVGEIARIDPAAHSFLIKLELPVRATARSGLFGRAHFPGPSRQTLVVPVSAAIRRGQLTFVFIVDAEGRARLQPISPGETVGDQLEVLAGLGEGTRIVVDPPVSLSEGRRVSERRP